MCEPDAQHHILTVVETVVYKFKIPARENPDTFDAEEFFTNLDSPWATSHYVEVTDRQFDLEPSTASKKNEHPVS